MRILKVVPSLSALTGGPAKSVAALCKGLASEGHAVSLLTTLWPEVCRIPESGLRQVKDGYEINFFPFENCFSGPSFPHSPALLRALDSMHQSFDITICHSLWNPIATFTMRTLRKKKIPYALMAHGMLDPLVLRKHRWKKFPWSVLWEKRNIETATLLLFNSEAERSKAELCGWRLNGTFVIPHLIDLAYWADLPPKEAFHKSVPQIRGCDVILFVGRLNWVKNLDRLVDALNLVRRRRPKAVLLCVGPDGDGERKRLQSRAKALGLANHVFFPGLLEGDDLKAAYACANLLVLVSKKENFGLTVADALASGLPVVVSEGVDVAARWKSSGPVRRVQPEPEAISEAIVDLLRRGEENGLPDAEARSLAQKEWGKTRLTEMVKRYQQALKEHAL